MVLWGSSPPSSQSADFLNKVTIVCPNTSPLDLLACHLVSSRSLHWLTQPPGQPSLFCIFLVTRHSLPAEAACPVPRKLCGLKALPPPGRLVLDSKLVPRKHFCCRVQGGTLWQVLIAFWSKIVITCSLKNCQQREENQDRRPKLLFSLLPNTASREQADCGRVSIGAKFIFIQVSPHHAFLCLFSDQCSH